MDLSFRPSPLAGRKRQLLVSTLLALALGTFAGGPAIAQHAPLADDVDAATQKLFWLPEILLSSIRHSAFRVPIEPESGWPISFELTANEWRLLGIGVPGVAGNLFPEQERMGFLVFDDPDGCPAFVDEGSQQGHNDSVDMGGSGLYPDCVNPPPPVPWPHDETIVEFTPGLTVPLGNDEPRPQITVFDASTGMNNGSTGIGPFLGATDDNYGYGASSRLPGLVLVSDTGPGVLTDADFNRPDPMVCRNLAGFANSVTYELANILRFTSVRVHLNVPHGLFSPVVLADRDLTADCSGDGDPEDTLLRIDGGPLHCLEGVRQSLSQIDFPPVTLRAYVVNLDEDNPGPVDTVTDLNGNGFCDAQDIRLAGYELVSHMKRVRFEQFHELEFVNGFDFDGNGDVGDVVAPAGPGQLTQPPR